VFILFFKKIKLVFFSLIFLSFLNLGFNRLNLIFAAEFKQLDLRDKKLEDMSLKCEHNSALFLKTVCLDKDVLNINQRLNVVLPYVVKCDDNLGNISKKFNTDKLSIMVTNCLKDEKVTKGDILFIPAVNYSDFKAIEDSTQEKEFDGVEKVEGKGYIKGHRIKKVLNMRATAYGIDGNGPWGPVTAMGTPLRHGVIAVDPRVIPLGTKVYVTGYKSSFLPSAGFIGFAEDTGGSVIRGKHIDIFINKYESQVSCFGIQNVKVYILE